MLTCTTGARAVWAAGKAARSFSNPLLNATPRSVAPHQLACLVNAAAGEGTLGIMDRKVHSKGLKVQPSQWDEEREAPVVPAWAAASSMVEHHASGPHDDACDVSTPKSGKPEKPDGDKRLRELFKLGKLALPLLLQYVIYSSSHMINTGFVGHLQDPVMLSSMVLATSLSMATGYSIISGIASATETLCGQAYGAKNYQAINDTLQRALLICGLACIPISFAWVNAEWILTHLGQPQDIAVGAARYLQLTLPALYLYTIHECVDKYLLSQRTVKPALVITTVSTMLTPVFAWHFVNQQGLGLDGAAYAYVGVQACTTTLGLMYLLYRETVQLPANPPEGYIPLAPSIGALTNWTPYVALAVPAVMSYCMEGWATEVLIFLSGLLPNADVAVGVTGLALQFSTTVWLAAASIGSATSTRVANKLGRGDAKGAQRTAQTATACVLASQALIGVAAYTYREPLLGLMTNNTEVIKLAMEVMPVLACCFIADGLNVVQGAVLRGAGRQWWTAGLNMAGWWGVGVPLAYYLALKCEMNVPGLWMGFATASALQSVLQFVAVNKYVDWPTEVQRAKEMMEGKPPVPESDDEGDDGGSGPVAGGPDGEVFKLPKFAATQPVGAVSREGGGSSASPASPMHQFMVMPSKQKQQQAAAHSSHGSVDVDGSAGMAAAGLPEQQHAAAQQLLGRSPGMLGWLGRLVQRRRRRQQGARRNA